MFVALFCLQATQESDFLASEKPQKCLIPADATQDDAYSMFLTCYGHQDDEKLRDIFYTNFQYFKPQKFNFDYYSKKYEVIQLPEVLGYDISKTLNSKLGDDLREKYVNRLKLLQNQPEVLKAVDCQRFLCSAVDQINHADEVLPEKADLAAKGLVTTPKDQGECGSCWAFSTISALENNVLYNVKAANKVAKASNRIPVFWTNEVKKGLDLSEQFLMSNTFGFSNYCEGGDFTTAVNYFDLAAQTIETEAHYPYDYAAHKTMHSMYIRLPSRLRKQDHYRPYKVFKNQIDKYKTTPVVEIYYDPFKPFDQNAINAVKSYLAHGIPVVGAMYVSASSPLLLAQGKTPVHEKCPKIAQNHQITIVGYEKLLFDGEETECWKVKNSWGPSWGDGGYFYVPVGQNSFCMETYAFTIIPREFDGSMLAAGD